MDSVVASEAIDPGSTPGARTNRISGRAVTGTFFPQIFLCFYGAPTYLLARGPSGLPLMSNSEFDGPSDQDWEDRGELAWNEFDWERYLRVQDEAVQRYLTHYEKVRDHPERLDETAHLMGWDEDDWSAEAADIPGSEASTPGDSGADADPYTLHKNPVFIATRGIYLSLRREWERLAADPANVPQPLALTFHSALHRGEDQAMLAIQALDFGDYAMSISLLKRALYELNATLALFTDLRAPTRALETYRTDALPRLFDLREIWLRVMAECRDELEQPIEDEEEE
jgi:hypothetical protein